MIISGIPIIFAACNAGSSESKITVWKKGSRVSSFKIVSILLMILVLVLQSTLALVSYVTFKLASDRIS